MIFSNIYAVSGFDWAPEQQVSFQRIREREVEGGLVVFQEPEELFRIELRIPVVVRL